MAVTRNDLHDPQIMPLAPSASSAVARPTWPSVKRGLRRRCPACGEGRVFRGYLTVNDHCPSCEEALHHHRADDFPQYLTIFVVGHVLVAALLAVDDLWPGIPVFYHFLIWPSLVVLLCLWLLPIAKGGLIAYQWALRMHGFDDAAPVESDRATPRLPPAERSAA